MLEVLVFGFDETINGLFSKPARLIIKVRLISLVNNQGIYNLPDCLVNKKYAKFCKICAVVLWMLKQERITRSVTVFKQSDQLAQFICQKQIQSFMNFSFVLFMDIVRKQFVRINSRKICIILYMQFSVGVVRDSIYPEVTRYTLKWQSTEMSIKYNFNERRLNSSHRFSHAHDITINIKQSILALFFFF